MSLGQWLRFKYGLRQTMNVCIKWNQDRDKKKTVETVRKRESGVNEHKSEYLIEVVTNKVC